MLIYVRPVRFSFQLLITCLQNTSKEHPDTLKKKKNQPRSPAHSPFNEAERGKWARGKGTGDRGPRSGRGALGPAARSRQEFRSPVPECPARPQNSVLRAHVTLSRGFILCWLQVQDFRRKTAKAGKETLRGGRGNEALESRFARSQGSVPKARQ